jgi:hypothetical protein
MGNVISFNDINWFIAWFLNEIHHNITICCISVGIFLKAWVEQEGGIP